MSVQHPAMAQDAQLRKQLNEAQDEFRRELREEKQAERFKKTDAPIVIELYTTTDCSSCVFTDRMIYDASQDKQVIALSCRIQDMSEIASSNDEPGAAPKKYDGPMDPCVFRQWTYYANRNDSDVTLGLPSFVFNGADRVESLDLSSFDNTLQLYHYEYKNKSMEIFMQWRDSDTITLHLPQDPKIEKIALNASVYLVRYKDMDVQRVDQGVNKGRVLRFTNIIQDIRHIAKWHGRMRSIDVDVPKPQGGKEKGGYVVLIQEMMGDPILAAGKLVDYPHPDDLKKAAERKKNAKPSQGTEAERAPTPAPASVPAKP